MPKLISQALAKISRLLSLVLLSVLGTSALIYAAPGYFADGREMDPTFAAGARSTLSHMQTEQNSLTALLRMEFRGWTHGDLGRSRQYDVPVKELLRERAAHSAELLTGGVVLGWATALLLALPFSLKRTAVASTVVPILTAVLLAVPVGVLATVCLLTGHGGPIAVLGVIVAARDCKLLYRMLTDAWTAPYVVHAQAQGMSFFQIAHAHLIPVLRRELLSVGVMSFTLALSALVPVEVVFDRPGLGQLAWTAAMNRDLPVLAAVTAVMSIFVGLAGTLAGSSQLKGATCA